MMLAVSCVLTLALLPVHGSEKEELTVTSIKDLELAVTKATPGTTIVLKDGSYRQKCSLKGKGTKEAPIVVRAETIGGIEMKEGVTIEGEHLSLIGFRFTANGGVQVTNGKACRISRCHMNNLNRGQWLRIDSGSRNIEVDHCLFEKKENNRHKDGGCQVLRVDQTNTKESHHIHHNHFRDIPKGKTSNGFETIQLITRGNPMDPKGDDTDNLLEHNLFERCDGEAEIISVKSNGNLLRGNTFRDCRGELVLRHGHRNVVTGNWFLGGSGGVRLQGRDQVVINNIFEDLGRGLTMMDGTIGSDLYMRVERALIAHNTFVDCSSTFCIGLNHSQYPEGTVPRACTIASNIFYQDNNAETGLITFNKDQEPEEWTWQNNLYHGKLGISGRAGLQQSSAFQMTGEPKLLLPTVGTPSAGRAGLKWPEGHDRARAGTAVEKLNVDLAGTSRPEQGTIGAFQFTGRPITAQPLTEKDVGPLAGLEKKE